MYLDGSLHWLRPRQDFCFLPCVSTIQKIAAIAESDEDRKSKKVASNRNNLSTRFFAKKKTTTKNLYGDNNADPTADA